jgi:tRNA/tmRNA/rRNA uracil-C5-methylase (TrmA/RlmC/RlmD family)
VPGGVPGDVVKTRVTEFKKRYAEARAVKIVTPWLRQVRESSQHVANLDKAISLGGLGRAFQWTRCKTRDRCRQRLY